MTQTVANLNKRIDQLNQSNRDLCILNAQYDQIVENGLTQFKLLNNRKNEAEYSGISLADLTSRTLNESTSSQLLELEAKACQIGQNIYYLDNQLNLTREEICSLRGELENRRRTVTESDGNSGDKRPIIAYSNRNFGAPNESNYSTLSYKGQTVYHVTSPVSLLNCPAQTNRLIRQDDSKKVEVDRPFDFESRNFSNSGLQTLDSF